MPEECPYCHQPVYIIMSEHLKICPSLVTKRSPAVLGPTPGQPGIPAKPPYEEGELPPHLKDVLRRKGSFLTEAKKEVE